MYIEHLNEGVDEQTIIKFIERINNKTILSIQILEQDDKIKFRRAYFSMKTPEEAQSLNGQNIPELSKSKLKIVESQNKKSQAISENSEKIQEKQKIEHQKPNRVKEVQPQVSQTGQKAKTTN